MDVLKRNNVTVRGQGTVTMMFAHGYGCDQNMWRYITPAFEKDYKIVLFDHVGAGHSDLSAYDREKYDDLESYADARVREWRNSSAARVAMTKRESYASPAARPARGRPVPLRRRAGSADSAGLRPRRARAAGAARRRSARRPWVRNCRSRRHSPCAW